MSTTSELKRDWLDAVYWLSQASKRGIRLPNWGTKATSRKLLRWHRRLSNEAFEDVYGCIPKRLIELNPRVPLRAFVGQMLETKGE